MGAITKGHTVLLGLCLLLSGCHNCESLTLNDSSCVAGDPNRNQYDPSKKELCSNFLDDNCDGQVNEGCVCIDGEEQKCGIDVGECRSTTVVCTDGKWPPCSPGQNPSSEICNGKDDDCNGVRDDNLASVECWDGPIDAIFSDLSLCRKGRTSCDEGTTVCSGEILPLSYETCNGIDDDCDGQVDEDPIELEGNTICGPPENGICHPGTHTCVDGEFYCLNAQYPQPELCNNVDDDCDEEIDEDLVRPCSTACEEGIETCRNGEWQGCSARLPTPETCNAVDDDCDGEVDEDTVCECTFGDIQFCITDITDRSSGQPVSCGRGVQICQNNGQWGLCYYFDSTEETCNNWDDDCDGVKDNFIELCGSDASFINVGACHPGTRLCLNGEWGTCNGAVDPQPESCNRIDDNCNGEVDEGLQRRNTVDIVFAIDASQSMCTYINDLYSALVMYADDFRSAQHRFGLVSIPGDSACCNPLTDYVYGTPDWVMTVRINLTTISNFLILLQSLGCDAYGQEPTVDALYQLASPQNINHINWRPDAYPYIVVVTDETPQTWNGLTDYDVEQTMNQAASMTTNCSIGGCEQGDKVEVFIISKSEYLPLWGPAVYYEQRRLLSINPVDVNYYYGLLNTVFTEVCR